MNTVHFAALLCLALLLSACSGTPPTPPTVPPPTLAPAVQRAVEQGAAFLHAQYSTDVGLLRESPITAPDVHWLTTDNRLAVWTLDAVGDADLARRLEATLAKYAAAPHGVIEALTGAPVTWPPRTPVQSDVAPGVKAETRSGDSEMLDWREYADLALYAALNAANRGDNDEARRLYDDALLMFDGMGFRDKAFDGRYTTYKLALAQIAARRIGVTPDAALLPQLLAQQGADGGFFAHYTADAPVGDANTETTAYALLALTGLRQPVR